MWIYGDLVPKYVFLVGFWWPNWVCGVLNPFWSPRNHIWAPKTHFGPKNAFWAQNALLAQKVIPGAQIAILSKNALWSSHELTYPQPKSPPCAAGAKNANFAPKMHSFSEIGHFHSFCDFGPKRGSFAKKVHFGAPMPRMLIKPMGNQ